MAKKNENGYLSAKESRRISRENRKITDQFEKLHNIHFDSSVCFILWISMKLNILVR